MMETRKHSYGNAVEEDMDIDDPVASKRLRISRGEQYVLPGESPFEAFLRATIGIPTMWENIIGHLNVEDVIRCLRTSRGLRSAIVRCIATNSRLKGKLDAGVTACAARRGFCKKTTVESKLIQVSRREKRQFDKCWESLKVLDGVIYLRAGDNPLHKSNLQPSEITVLQQDPRVENTINLANAEFSTNQTLLNVHPTEDPSRVLMEIQSGFVRVRNGRRGANVERFFQSDASHRLYKESQMSSFSPYLVEATKVAEEDRDEIAVEGTLTLFGGGGQREISLGREEVFGDDVAEEEDNWATRRKATAGIFTCMSPDEEMLLVVKRRSLTMYHKLAPSSSQKDLVMLWRQSIDGTHRVSSAFATGVIAGYVATTPAGKLVRVWNENNGSFLRTFPIDGGAVTKVASNTRGPYIVFEDNQVITIVKINPENGSISRTLINTDSFATILLGVKTSSSYTLVGFLGRSHLLVGTLKINVKGRMRHLPFTLDLDLATTEHGPGGYHAAFTLMAGLEEGISGMAPVVPVLVSDRYARRVDLVGLATRSDLADTLPNARVEIYKFATKLEAAELERCENNMEF